MQRDLFFLRDILDSISAMELFWAGLSEEVFVRTDVVRCAVEIASVEALELRGQVQAIIDQLENPSRAAQKGDS